jgi:ferredoxin-NADP reductase/Na+-translocating ferredoxin:NAD+ oxidoreductase RnfD subunit
MTGPLNRLLNRVTMYRLVLYGLVGLVAVSLIVSLTGRSSFSPLELLISLGLLMGSAFGANLIFGRVWNVPTNRETWVITALILSFVLQPAHDIATGLALVLAGGLSSASKFLLAPFGKHVFNPAALGAAFVSLIGITPSTWWVGTSALWPFTLLLGIAVYLKIRRYALGLVFVSATLIFSAVQFAVSGQPLGPGLLSVVTASPLLFLGGVMLTEPSTMPPTRRGQSIFGVIVSVFFVLAPEVGPLIVYPEVALLIGNVYAYFVGPKRRYRLTLARIERISERVYNYVFTSSHPLSFRAGQYMEWTLAGVPSDGRGNRRSFTIASSPTEDTVQVGLKYYEPSSTYKKVFANLKPGDTIFAGQISGSFTIDGLQTRKLALIAGGVGITPFRSMIKQIVDEGRNVDITLFYSVAELSELAYLDVFRAARSYGVRLIPVSPNPNNSAGVLTGRMTPELIRDHLPDFADRTFLVSGPNAMVQGVSRTLHQLGVARRYIRTDYFSGY